jgi:hypothetical protein
MCTGSGTKQQLCPDDAGISFNSHISYGNLIVLKGVAELTGPLAGFEIKGTLTVQESGTFIGGGDMETVLSIGNIVIGNGGVFMGSDGMGNTAYNVSGSISVAGVILWIRQRGRLYL